MTTVPSEASAIAEKIGLGNVGQISGGTFIINFYGTSGSAEPAREIGEVPGCPYKGLAYFGPADANCFFGRDSAIEQLVSAVGKQSLTALVGPSGCGKSSVVLAGVAPKLHADGGWAFTYFRIAESAKKNPFVALAGALTPLIVSAMEPHALLRETKKIADDLESSKICIASVLDRCRKVNAGRRILVIADQFEEVFTLVEQAERRRRFIDLIVEGFSQQNDTSELALILTLRADFYKEALLERGMAAALQNSVVNLGPMTRNELRAAIESPAFPVVFRDGLVDTLLDDVASQSSALPLLQFALREMWTRLESHEMTRAIYDEIGGIKGALQKRADAVYARVTTNGRDLAAVSQFRALFTRLVNFIDDAAHTRRTAGHDELGTDVWRLAQTLAGEENRLVVIAAPAPGKETVEIAHEALITNWPALRDFIEADREFGAWLRQLRVFLEEHRKHPEDEGTLLRGSTLVVAVDWRKKRGADLSEEERAFVDVSEQVVVNVRRRERRAQSVRRISFAIIAAGGLAIPSLAIWALWHDWLRVTWHRTFELLGYVKSPENDRLLLNGGMTFRDCRDCPEMIFVREGSFERGGPLSGSPDAKRESPISKVHIRRSFAVSVTEITFAQ